MTPIGKSQLRLLKQPQTSFEQWKSLQTMLIFNTRYCNELEEPYHPGLQHQRFHSGVVNITSNHLPIEHRNSLPIRQHSLTNSAKVHWSLLLAILIFFGATLAARECIWKLSYQNYNHDYCAVLVSPNVTRIDLSEPAPCGGTGTCTVFRHHPKQLKLITIIISKCVIIITDTGYTSSLLHLISSDINYCTEINMTL